MEQNEKVIDISETPIGNYGAACIAAVLSLCDQLEEIRLGNCEIKDEGAINLFEELKSNASSVKIVDLSNNQLTEKCIDSLVEALSKNPNLQLVEMKNTLINKLKVMHKIAPYKKRVTL
eukprot:CAMPEP_0202959788 /NCGR_PEP_ID=MMETSP1396-20130829/3972_1 /ASSEMBLY_ACC=CAM_ASM_000872 /TAXON_ID= /ORGANISM="Pseudokeronopsis sp., Strain Brazil" /LENGTH=118 /DNA_ID=CAMNT_0049678569 /DNA_START=1482 /DNA_END=1838 /DNA_ORIENTATION=+